jgi:Rrf2 family protein
MAALYSTTCSHAVLAISRLAALPKDRAWRVQDICDGTDLPERFVSKILGELVRANLLLGLKGRNGGFKLARPADKILLADVVEAIDGLSGYARCIAGLSQCNEKLPCPQHEKFAPLRKQMLGYFHSTTVDQMSKSMLRKADLIDADRTADGLPIVNNVQPLGSA